MNKKKKTLYLDHLTSIPNFPKYRIWNSGKTNSFELRDTANFMDWIETPTSESLLIARSTDLTDDTIEKWIYLLHKHRIAGLVIYNFNHTPSPERIRGAVSRLVIPFIEIFEDKERSVESLMKDWTFILACDYSYSLNRLYRFSQQVQQAVIKSAQVRTILECLHNFGATRTLYLSIAEPSLLFPENNSIDETDSIIPEEVLELLENQSSLGRKLIKLSLSNGVSLLVQPVLGLGHVLSFIGIVLHSEGEPSSLQEEVFWGLLLDFAGKTAEQLLLRRLLLEDRASDGQASLIQSILFGDLTNEDQMLAQIGLSSLTSEHYLFVSGVVILEHSAMTGEGNMTTPSYQDMVMLLRSLLSTHGIYNLLLLHNNVIHVLCIRETFGNKQAQWLKVKQSLHKVIGLLQKSSRLRSNNTLIIHAGFGHMKGSLREASQSYREAIDAVSIARTLEEKVSKSIFYEDMGIYQMLKSIGNTERLIQFIHFHLGQVIDYDRQANGTLLLTLEQYLSCMGGKQETAERLFIHRQTLYHRLDKLNELLGEDYLRADRRLCLEVAIRAYELVKHTM
ncbi:hypothetical protein J41TS12_35100 [Paenibacillus antibioticophila]|uniref:PucR C-terminal helix-turn-helix domain-containing protein n=1 Tax=Paenibacillus antibioticophila TaxID=1274374 RepID=A0A920CIS9_9BACL|nr:PucR family transcriptional regulator [Paenibacillus antibioticophila]GIO38649.1 hypothetical protein J41TS12_35100 [Paenibacillus antibioticophila]